MAKIVDLKVYLNSDGSLMSYSKDGLLNTLFTDNISWGILAEIYNLTCTPSAKRKSLSTERNLKYVEYYFRETVNNQTVPIDKSHIPRIIDNLKL
jgi:hypothetical protein